MKKNKFYLGITLGSLFMAGIMTACKEEFLELDPIGAYSESSLTNKKGVEGMLIATYAALDGRPETQATGSTNWIMGSVAADDANKGSEAADFNTINPIELYQQTPSNVVINDKWRGAVDGIGMANQVLRTLKLITDASAADAARIEGEARFLRAFFHMEGKKVFDKGFPWIPETAVTNEDYKAITNQADIWPQIEADFRFAMENLPPTQADRGRANKWAAAAFLGKALIYQKKYAEALTILKDVMANGTNAQGTKYALNPNYGANFRVATKNSAETVFVIQYAINDGAGNNSNANYEQNLNFPHGGSGDRPGGCCGFFQPSQALVNSYMTDAATGLPRRTPYATNGVTSDYQRTSSQPFTPYAGTLDPRLDHTVGRRGIQYLDWGAHPGRNWIRDINNGGPYSPKKNVHSRAELTGGSAGTGSWGQPANALSFPVMRYADVILLTAEAEAQAGSLSNATDLVNIVRERAGSQETIEGIYMVGSNTEGPVANYKVGLYTTPFASKDAAMTAIMEERRLELAMEGHRKFDLVRWGIAAQTLNAYASFEKTYVPKFTNAQFSANQDEFMPVPELVINTSRLSSGQFNLKQNEGYQ
ncbi:RagB/SusD family nutrient uptake outer membrane protein [Pontibacter sp. SGAir0037]|uniref:RagB/SusD family nutrient uptake outer membrane protein n=1 Tax=Pontibacter sp. SGAir0037 TaxID=2571030 RepID=UPI00143D2B52|nr:RagB/SusD family nutrient uptake outer membrane protein [Pontibacter sp. SGAir0037]